MKNTFYKIIRIKITVIVCAIVLFFIAVQTPWLKKIIADQFVKELSKVTNSKVKVRSYEGFIPFNFDFYGLSFSQNNEVWLTLDRISFNRTLIQALILKFKSIDIEFLHPHIKKLPENYPVQDTTFKWPSIPLKHLSLNLKAYEVQINPELTPKMLPKFNSFISFNSQRNGENLHIKTKFNSSELKGTEIRLNVRGFKKRNRLYLNFEIKDPHNALIAYYYNKELFNLEGSASAVATPQSLMAFFKPSLETQDSFEGSLNLTLDPLSRQLFSEVFENESIKISSDFAFTASTGLNFENTKLSGHSFSLKGQGTLDRNYVFKNTQFSGSLENLDFLSPLFKEDLSGQLDLSLALSDPLSNPNLTLSWKAKSIDFDHYSLEQNEGVLKLQKEEAFYHGFLSLKGVLNQVAYTAKTDFKGSSFKDFSLENLSAQYGNDEIRSTLFKSFKEIYQGRVFFELENLALLSPFIKREIHGGISGNLILDAELTSGKLKQKTDLSLQGSLFQISDLEVKNFTLNVDGALNLKDWKSFEGTLLTQNEGISWGKYSFDTLTLVLNPKKYAASYKLNSTGIFSINSSGHLNYSEPTYKLLVRILDGQIQNYFYNLQESTFLSFSKHSFDFSTLQFKVGPGSFFVELDPKEDLLKMNFEKFPVETLAEFIPNFDVQGFVNLKGQFSRLSTEMKGSIDGEFYQFRIEDHQNMSPYRGQFQAELKKETLMGKVSFLERNRDKGNVNFILPFKMRLYPFKARFLVREHAEIDLEYKGKVNPFIQMILPQNHFLQGRLNINMALRGPLEHPKIKGLALLQQGYYENLFLGLVLKNIDTTLKGKGNHLTLENFNAYDDLNGKVTTKGRLSLNFKHSMPYYLDIDIQKAKIIQFDFLDGTFDGQLSFEGNLKGASLKGDLDITQANVMIPNSFGSNLPKLPVTYLYARDRNCLMGNQKLGPPIPIKFKLGLKIADTISLKGRGLNTVWKGSFDIKGTDQSPKFEGRLTNAEGSFVFAGKTLNLEEGVIEFDGDILKKTHINLVGSTQVHNARITAYLKGPIEGPKLSFRSDPPFSQTEILSLILFNEPVQKLTPFQAVALTHSLATLSGTYLGPDIIDKVRRGVGVDQLSFGSSLEGGDYTTIQIGKYITRNVLVTLSRPLSIGTSPFIITAHVKGGFEIQTFFDENELSKILIQWKLSY